MGLALSVAAELVGKGEDVKPFVVLSANTKSENPSVHALAQREMAKVRNWIERYNLPGTTHVIAYPNLASQFAVAVIGGRALPSLAGGKRDCTTDWKTLPLPGPQGCTGERTTSRPASSSFR